MKNILKIKKKNLATLSKDKSKLPNALTPNVAGGVCTNCASGCHELVQGNTNLKNH
ncbi:hypothetical protein L1077_26600 [Pseudoalteromonas luteoviolacea]|uniref:hypothetical protein n=1 Tax=Pseudoalteromonas luteoviolacea TaxID=43657 RepID=UPI001F462143|nr:hypothetical protein [Pseudoalteromonas luteoviolacea]MCF6442999.1 hypothetical protein [Pseudoalteromonas luteoviolacea]